MMSQKQKKFDAVAESRKWRAAVSAELAAMTPEEQIKFLNEATLSLPQARPQKCVPAPNA